MSIAEVRHLPKVIGILLVTDKEFFSDIDPLPFSTSSQLLYSGMEEVVKQQLGIFESLWNKSVSGEKKIAEVEKDIVSNGTKELTDENEIKFRTFLLKDPYKTQQLLIQYIQKATKEILIILPSINAFFRHRKIGIFNILEKKLFNINNNNK